MIINHARAGPNSWTFKIKPIKELVDRYVGDGTGWVDMFAGDNSPAEFTNDGNPDIETTTCNIDAFDFVSYIQPEIVGLPGFSGVIVDPPYTKRQISEHYKKYRQKATKLDTSNRFLNQTMNSIADKIKPSGYAISCGYNSNGFGPNRGFEPVELLVVAHGSGHYDTLVLVERRVLP
ncbi:MAG: hypothetical protein NTW33_01630 [Methanoregula sp.]|nr:hypothetical protein [Methanoregula sp.]